MESKKILVVEDEALVALEIMSILNEAGFEIVGPVGTVNAAMTAIETERFDAALLDINLHNIPSFDIAKALQKKEIPFAFVTAYSNIPFPPELRTAPLLRKPTRDQQLVAMAKTLAGIG
jgi:two-component SAPR family response regulator